MTSRNDSPIGCISVEILCLIFSLSRSELKPHLGSFDVHRQNLSVVRLTAVCSHWRSVAIEHAALWSNIAFTTSSLPTINCATTFLRRSKGAPLHVQVWNVSTVEYAPLRRPPCSALSDLLSLISSQRHRIVFLETIGQLANFFNALQGPAENVARIIVQGHTPRRHLDPFSGKLPNVRRISFIFPCRCRLRTLVNLTEVTLHNDSRKWNLDEFLDFVDGCSSLKSLTVTRFVSFYQGSGSSRVVSLPALADIRLDTCDAASILGHLKIPATTSVFVCTDVKYLSNDSNIFSCMPSNIDRINFLQSAKSLTIALDNSRGSFYISGFNGMALVFLLQLCGPLEQLDDDWVYRSLEEAASILPFSDTTSLTLVTDSPRVPWDSWLRRCNHLSVLDVWCIDVCGLVEALNRTRRDIPLCHTIKNLSIIAPLDLWSRNAGALKSAIYLRKTHGSALSHLTMSATEWDTIKRLDPTWVGLVRSKGSLFSTWQTLTFSHASRFTVDEDDSVTLVLKS